MMNVGNMWVFVASGSLRKGGGGIELVSAFPSGTEILELVTGSNAVNIDTVNNLGFSIGLSGNSQLDLATVSEGLTLRRSSQSKTAAKLFGSLVYLIRQTISRGEGSGDSQKTESESCGK